MRTRGERLRAAREKRFRSARAAAIALGFPISSYGAHERAESPGGRDYGPDEARQYARYFAVTPEWLLTGYDPDRGQPASSLPKKLKVVGYVGTRGTVHLYQVSSAQAEYLETDLPIYGSTVALEIRDPSIMGVLPKNWIVVFDHTERRPTPDLIGKLCIVAYDDKRIVLEVLRKSAKRTRWATPVKAILPR